MRRQCERTDRDSEAPAGPWTGAGRGRRGHVGAWPLVAGALLSAILATAPQRAEAREFRTGELQTDLDRIIAESKVGEGITLSITLRDPATDRVLASYEPDAAVIPASNMKLLTSGVALDVLRPGFAFETELAVLDPAPGAGGAVGPRVVVRGSGDPAFADPDLLDEMMISVGDLVAIWVSALFEAGSASPGEVVVDDRVFDRDYVHPSWPAGQLNRHYCAGVAGVNFHRNVISLFTEPTRVGAPPELETEPDAPWLDIQNRARTVSNKRQHTAWASRGAGGNDITLHGDVRFSSNPVEVTLHDVPTFFGELLAHRLRRAGGEPGPVRLAALDDDLAGGRTVHVVRTPLELVLERCNKNSVNLYAEALIKRLGHEVTGKPGDWPSGAAVLRMTILERLGAEFGSVLRVADGSGMSRENRVTTRLVAEWLDELAEDPELSEAFYRSLPIAGAEGTLERRFRDETPEAEVRAKSGYLSGVSALSGYVTDPETGRRLIFSVITNNKPRNVTLASVRRLEEAVVLLLDRELCEAVTAGVDAE